MSLSETIANRSGEEMGQRIFALFCAFYFTGNFVFRWAAWQFFNGHGAYGWPEPTHLKIAVMVLAVLASSLAVFYFLPFLVAKIAVPRVGHTSRKRALNSLTGVAMILAIIYMEVDSDWYALSREHIRLSDVAIFLESNAQDHFGITTLHIVRISALLVGHALILALVYWAIIKCGGASMNSRHSIISSRINLSLLFLVATGSYVSLDLIEKNDSQWSAIAHHNLYDITPSRFINYRHPDADALDRMLADNSVLKQAVLVSATLPQGEPVKASKTIRHVLVITIEGWNTNYVGPDTMPFFTELEKVGVRYTDHYSSGNNTLLGILGLVYGQSPAFFFGQQADNNLRSPFIPQLNALGFSLKRFGWGLSSYRNIEGYLRDFKTGSEAPKFYLTLSDIQGHIQNNERSFSLFYYGDTHFPYKHAAEFSGFQPETPESENLSTGVKPDSILKVRNRYKNTLLQADASLKALFKAIDWRNMLIVITGDHGEAMMENGRLSHSSSLEKPQVSTPLFIYYPGITPATFMQTSSHLDVMPTIFDILGLQGIANGHGHSLLRQYGNRQAFAVHNNQNNRPTQVGIINGKSKLVIDISSLEEPRVIDLLSSDDQVVRLSRVEQEELADSMKYFSEIMAISGCPIRSQAWVRNTVAQNQRGALRHCR